MTGILRVAKTAATSVPRRIALAASTASSGPCDGGCSSKRGFSALLTPLEEFPGTPQTTPTPSSASTTHTTTLSNGLTVISEDSHNTCTISLTFPHAGTYSERSPSETGASLVNRYLSFKSGSGLSSAVILRNLEDDGATPFATCSRYGASVGFTASREKAVRLVPLLATSGSFERWDVRDAKKYAAIAVDEALTNVQTVLTESVYSASYGAQNPAGKSQYSTSPLPTASAIESFRDRAYDLNGAVLAATGIPDHDQFCEAVSYGFSESPTSTGPTQGLDTPPPVFLGGETRVHVPGAGSTHLAVSFGTQPASAALLQVAAMCVGSGANGAVDGFSAPVGTMGSGGGGIIGAYSGAVPAGAAPEAIDRMCEALTGPPPSVEVVERAKASAKARALFEMEDGSRNLAEGMTRGVLEYEVFGGGSLAALIAAEYDAVTVEGVGAVLAGLVMGGVQPAIASVGDVTSVPYLSEIAPRFS